ncbi:hypothetical protein [Actinoallomurus sp. NPDC050550]
MKTSVTDTEVRLGWRVIDDASRRDYPATGLARHPQAAPRTAGRDLPW